MLLVRAWDMGRLDRFRAWGYGFHATRTLLAPFGCQVFRVRCVKLACLLRVLLEEGTHAQKVADRF